MKRTTIATAVAFMAAASILSTAAKRDAEPTLMKINNKEVPVSEFVYLYEKNNQQQTEPQTVDEYVDMFVRYKLKVADAEAAAMDTTSAFKAEFAKYCEDLAAPYLTDTAAMTRLYKTTYERMGRNVRVSHIMMPLGVMPNEALATMNTLDSIRTLIVNGADMADLARRYSSDRSAAHNGGEVGWLPIGKFPYAFEEVAFSTPVGQVSEVFEDAPYGYHIIKVLEERPDAGMVQARHILKMTRGASEEEAAAKKAEIDSIYTLLKNGADFADIARRESEDPGSAQRGGLLPPFGMGQMVPEFEQVAFSTPDGQVSEPFASAFGYHIILTEKHIGVPEYQAALPSISAMISRDERANEPRRAKIAQLRQLYGVDLEHSKPLADLHKAIDAADGMTPEMRENLLSDWTTVADINGKKVLMSDVAKNLRPYGVTLVPGAAHKLVDKAANVAVDNAVVDYTKENLAATNPDYRNLVNEYHDGILLFDISNERIWNKSTHDREGLEEFFRANRGKYTWDQPHYKTYIIAAPNDSVADLIKADLANIDLDGDTLVTYIKKNFGRRITVQRKVMAKGQDAEVDYLGFGQQKPEAEGKVIVGYKGRMLAAPEDAGDVRSKVVADYQQYLEDRWIDELQKKYPVKIDKKQLKKLKERYANKTK